MENNCAYLYGRYSPRPVKAGIIIESIDTQFSHCRKFCELKGLFVAGCYSDEGLSGARADNRVELQKVLNVVCAQSATLVVYSLSRLARSTADAIQIAQRIEKAGANLVSVKETIDSSTPVGRFVFTLLAAVGQLERENTAERTSDALQRMQSEGKLVSRQPPFGFEISPDDPKRIRPSDRESRIAKLIHSLRAKGWTHAKIIASLERRKIVFRNSPWSSYSIARAIEFAESQCNSLSPSTATRF